MNHYNNYSKKNYNPNPAKAAAKIEPEAVETDILDTCIYVQANVVPNEPEVEVEVETEIESEETDILVGIVEGCKKLNVREEPHADGEVVTVVEAGKELIIDEEKSTDDWYCVCTASGAEGFCMKKFVAIKD